MNRCDCLDPLLPFTGINDSGRGTAYSKYGFTPFYRLKAMNFTLH